MKSLIYTAVNCIARSIRGSTYNIDSRIPLRSIISIATTRLSNLLRALVIYHYPPRRKIFIGSHSTIKSRHLLHLSTGISIGKHCHIDATSINGIRFGKNVSLGEYCRLEASGTITNIGLGIEIGSNTGIGAFSFIGGAGGIKIGSDVIMGQWVSFHPENHNIDDLDIPIRLQGVNRQGITVEDDCWIGAKATFLDGAHVGRGCVIAAGAVVRGTIPPYSIAAGVPAKVIRTRVRQSEHASKHPVPPSVG